MSNELTDGGRRRADGAWPAVADAATQSGDRIAQNIIDNVVIDQIPILSVLRASLVGIRTFRRERWIRKVAAVIDGFGPVDDDELATLRVRYAKRGDEELGEIVADLVERSETLLKNRLIGALAHDFLAGDLGRDQFLSAAQAVSLAPIVALEELLATPSSDRLSAETIDDLMPVGLASTGAVYLTTDDEYPKSTIRSTIVRAAAANSARRAARWSSGR